MMAEHHENVERFVAAVRRRKNLHRLWTTLIWAITLGAGLMIVIGLCYVARGYAVPAAWVGAICGAALFLAAGLWAARRLSDDRAARFIDLVYRLQDAVSSYLHFASQGRRDGYYALQAEQTADRIANLDAGTIRYRPPKRLLCLTLVLLAVAVTLGLAPPSDAVRERLALEEKIEKETQTAKQELLKEAEKLIEETRGKEEEKLLEPNKLRRWVEELTETKDRAEALRQYARLDRKLNEVRKSLERKQDEQLLERAAAELAKGEETKPMADTLAKKDYEKAAEKLDELKPKESKSPDQMKHDLAKLKAIAQRMALAAQTAKPASQGKKNAAGNASKNANPSTKQSAGASAEGGAQKSGDQSDSPSQGELSEAIGELAEAAENLDKSEKDQEKSACEKCFCDRVDKLGDKLKKLSICRKADNRLCKLCRKCGECQSGLCSCSSPNAGGHKAGWGTNTDRRKETDELVDNGQTTQLKGIKGSGQSVATVEAADSGSGVSTRRAAARELQFKHQFESFVQREDVPEDVKDGVKQYFQIIHEADADTSPKGDSKE
jgi:hypothetical protein